MANIPGFMLYHDQLLPFISRMTVEEAGIFLISIYNYSCYGEEYEGQGLPAVAFDIARLSIDRDREKYQRRCEQNKKNAESRWGFQGNRDKPDARPSFTDLGTETDRLLRILRSED